MSSTPFMQLYVNDYLSDTLDLTTEQHGAYLLLLMTMWRNGAALPNEPKKLARIARCDARRWHIVWPEIERFFYVSGDTLRHKRVDQEHQKATLISLKRSAAGQHGAAAKALKNNDAPSANAEPLLKHSQKSEVIQNKTEANASAKNRGARIPENFFFDLSEAVRLGLSQQEASREADKFRDYWVAQPGQKGVKLDWPATWRNWCRNAAERRRPSNGPKKITDVAREWMEQNCEQDDSSAFDSHVERLSAGSHQGREPLTLDVFPAIAGGKH